MKPFTSSEPLRSGSPTAAGISAPTLNFQTVAGLSRESLELPPAPQTVREMAASGLGWEDIVNVFRELKQPCDADAIRAYVLGRKWR